MADEGNERRRRRMDLNLYLGLPLSPRPRSLDLGSDLALSSLPLSSSSTTGVGEVVLATAAMSGAVELSESSHPPYSPSHAEYTPDMPGVFPTDGVSSPADDVSSPADDVSSPEYNPASPSWSPFAPASPTPSVTVDPEEPVAPYFPPSAQPLLALRESEEGTAEDADSYTPFDPISPTILAESSSAQAPPYIPGSTTLQDHEEADFTFYRSIPHQMGEFPGLNDGFSLRHDLLQSPQSRFRRLMESNHRWPIRRFRSLLPYAGERFNFGSPSSGNPAQILHDVLRSQRPSDVKVPAENNVAEESEGEVGEKNAANFECNICFDMAAEPVVTSCGHLFCWPCLYQWLHVHSDHKECPVCKGEVTESNITPIYGRGNTQSSSEKQDDESRESGFKIPPRPHGNRLQSFRQQFQPISRRWSEALAPWGRLLDQRMRSATRSGAQADPGLRTYEGFRRRVNRWSARMLQRDLNPESSVNGELGLPGSSLPDTVSGNTSSIFQDGIDIWQRFSYGLGAERLSAITADLGRAVGQFTSIGRNGASTSSINPQNPEPPMDGAHVGATLAADQGSASSTMAVILGDNASSDALADPNSAGSSWSQRRRGRSNTPVSLDVDGGTLHVRKRRRLN